MWAKKGTRPRAIKQGGFLSAYIFAAVCPKTGLSSAVIMPEVNGKMMQIHLDMISKEIEPGRHAVIVTDRAPWHTTTKIKIPHNISLLFLPPYSPELNGVEKIWDFMRQHELANRAFNSYDEIEEACCVAWKAIINEPGRITSISSRSWATC
jgi:transposase